jgi:hypothetical protein
MLSAREQAVASGETLEKYKHFNWHGGEAKNIERFRKRQAELRAIAAANESLRQEAWSIYRSMMGFLHLLRGTVSSYMDYVATTPEIAPAIGEWEIP